MLRSGRSGRSSRFLATILFTDIVGSTGLAQRLGDADWRRLVAAHHTAVRRELRRFGGQEVDTAGDGFLASFGQPAEAVRDFLASHFRLRRENLTARGYGETRPETRERNDEEMLRNRRVELRVLNPEVLPKNVKVEEKK